MADSGFTLIPDTADSGSDDRNMVIYPFTQGDPNGFGSGSIQRLMLDTSYEVGATTKLSRITNTEDDDRYLSAIVAEANAFNADFMLSIHTNAGVTNYICNFIRLGRKRHTYISRALLLQKTAKGSRY